MSDDTIELKGRNVVSSSIGDRLSELGFSSESDGTLYLHIAHSHKSGSDKGIFACALYTNVEGSNNKSLVGQSIVEKTLDSIAPKDMAITSYELALKLIYSWQNILYANGVFNIFIVTDNKYLFNAVQGLKGDTTGRLDGIEYKYLNLYGSNYISLNVSLNVLIKTSKAKKYCNSKYVNLSNLKLENLNDKVAKVRDKTSDNNLEGMTIDDIVDNLNNLDIEDILS